MNDRHRLSLEKQISEVEKKLAEFREMYSKGEFFNSPEGDTGKNIILYTSICSSLKAIQKIESLL